MGKFAGPRISKKDRAALKKVVKDLKTKKNGRSRPKQQVATRSMGEIVLAQGVGRVPRTPFGGRDSINLKCWDAFDDAHAALPRSVGPYAIVRATRIFQTSDRYMIFGPNVNAFNEWTTTIAHGAPASKASNAINGPSQSYRWSAQVPGAIVGGDSSFTCVPSAFSLQVLNTNPVQSAGGLIYAAVCPTQLSLADNTRTWAEFETQFTSYMRPRLMSGGKLALRGVQCNSYPLNMSALANFDKIADYGDGVSTWATGTGVASDGQYPTGFAPIVVINASDALLSYAVTTEYRVRFDLNNPGVSSHRHHGVTPDHKWDSMMRKAVSLGNGVIDIADKVATFGQLTSRLAPGLMA